MIFSQSTIKTFMACPLKYRFGKEDGIKREQSSALSFGTVIHEAVMIMETEHDPDAGIKRFDTMWDNLEACGLQYDYLLPRNDHKSYHDLGHMILRNWWKMFEWESDVVLAREYEFLVDLPGGDQLRGIVDKLALRPLKEGGYSVLTADYKTGAKAPTRDYLAHDLQFTAYCFASTRPEYWENIDGGSKLYAELKDAPREGEWIHLRTAKRIPAGVRTEMHYNRLMYAADQIRKCVELGIYVPDISGENCNFCEFRKPCGLPSRAEEELEIANT
jgi:CRISPR/Cas system-associated exonuclease Cas4 (RecB family)